MGADGEEAPPAPRYVLGIDVGAGTLVAASGQAGAASFGAVLVQNELSSPATPSFVGFTPKGRVFGDTAAGQAGVNGLGTVPAAPVLVRRKRDPFARYEPAGESGEGAYLDGFGYAPEAVLAMLLSRVAELGRAARPAGELLTRVTLAVPVAFSPAEQRAVLDAATIAGLPEPELVTAAAAAATCYSVKHPVPEGAAPRRALFVDCGYCFTGAAVYELGHKVPPRLVSQAGRAVGARDLDRALWECLASELETKHGVRVPRASKMAHKLMGECERAKRTLSTVAEASVDLECFGPDDRDFRLKVSRERFEQLTSELRGEVAAVVAEALAGSGGAAEELHAVEVVGGAARVPALASAVSAAAGGRKLGVMLDSASCVATGAAFRAQADVRDRPFEPASPPPVAAPVDAASLPEGVGAPGLERAAAAEAELRRRDEEEAALSEAHNALEAYVLEVRGSLSGKHADKLDASVVGPMLDEAEEWLYGEEAESADLIAVSGKLAGLRERVEAACPAYLEAVAAEKAKLEAELAAESARRAAEEALEGKDDHDQRKLKFPDRMRLVVNSKEEGTGLFKDGNFGPAAQRWGKALAHCDKFFDVSPEQQAEVTKVRVSLHSNVAMANLKLGTEDALRAAVKACGEVLALDADNVKALFRRASASEKLKEYEAARKDLARAAELDPSDTSIAKLAERVEALIKRQAAKEKQMFGRMFG